VERGSETVWGSGGGERKLVDLNLCCFTVQKQARINPGLHPRRALDWRDVGLESVEKLWVLQYCRYVCRLEHC
jgi:hypothetical protein